MVKFVVALVIIAVAATVAVETEGEDFREYLEGYVLKKSTLAAH